MAFYHVSPRGIITDTGTGERVTDTKKANAILDRLASLKVPPAYRNVLLSKDPSSKVLACGMDSKNRKQYIYNPEFIEEQKRQRFAKIKRYHKTITRIIQKVKNVVKEAEPQLTVPTWKVYQICMVIHVMMLCNFRIGNTKYARENGSYGITTLEWRHVKLAKNAAEFRFTGKKGVENHAICDDPYVVGYVRQHHGARHKPVFPGITSDDVNAWLKEEDPVADITCKDLRTWRANQLFQQYVKNCKDKREAVRMVSTELHNTPNVCKKNYIDPSLLANA